jgi:hypothetical protein
MRPESPHPAAFRPIRGSVSSALSRSIVVSSIPGNGTRGPVEGASPTDVHRAPPLTDLARFFTPPFSGR